MKDVHAVDPIATSAKTTDGSTVIITIGGVGADGLDVKIGRQGFEVLGNCSADPTVHPPFARDLCWIPCNITASTANTITVGGVPPTPSAVRYLWYSSPCGSNSPYQCPVYAKVAPLGTLSGEDKQLPLGPFLMKLS